MDMENMHDMQNFSPSMLTYPDPTEFDYNAFLQPPPDDMGLQHQQLVGQIPLPSPIQPSPTGGRMLSGFSDSSAGRATPPESDTRSASHELVRASSVLSPAAAAAAAGKGKLERRGHTKSRRGCYNCKRRRIKVRCGRLST
jgi:hypothetical protein